jgi:branched-chain amino acid transport system ATP-binding protein
MTPLLQLEGVSAAYGPSQALHGVDLEIGEGEVVALMGRNGMGKTTTVRVACALLRPCGGAIGFAGRSIIGLPAHRVARLGIGLVPEGRRCFAPLTVTENLVAAARAGPWDLAAVTQLFPRLGERRKQTARTLSGGEQQMLAIGRALMTNPHLLILDEATEGLAPMVRREIWAALAELKNAGLSILVIDKNARALAAIADRAVILERGSTVWSGVTSALTPEVTDRWLGV